jgi:uncharacterized protein YutE (UPF0331/DUF86 family)
MNRIKDKSEEIDKYLEELETILPESFEEYFKSIEKKAACERYFEKIIESLIDLSFLIIKEEKFEIPENNEIFEVLLNKEIINKNIYQKIKKAKGMRNIIAHKYGEIDDEIVFESLTEELIPDITNFLEVIEIYFNKN